VQFSLSLVALKALPVVILGGLTRCPARSSAACSSAWGEALRGLHRADARRGIEIWFAYVLALLFLLVRPQGLFGEKIIDRV